MTDKVNLLRLGRALRSFRQVGGSSFRSGLVCLKNANDGDLHFPATITVATPFGKNGVSIANKITIYKVNYLMLLQFSSKDYRLTNFSSKQSESHGKPQYQCLAQLGPCNQKYCNKDCCWKQCRNDYNGLHPVAYCEKIPGSAIRLCACYHDCFPR